VDHVLIRRVKLLNNNLLAEAIPAIV